MPAKPCLLINYCSTVYWVYSTVDRQVYQLLGSFRGRLWIRSPWRVQIANVLKYLINPEAVSWIPPSWILERNVGDRSFINPFTPESDQCQNSPAASQEIWHHTVWRTWLFIANSDEKWLYYKFSLHHSYNRFLKGWENTLLELRSERVKSPGFFRNLGEQKPYPPFNLASEKFPPPPPPPLSVPSCGKFLATGG